MHGAYYREANEMQTYDLMQATEPEPVLYMQEVQPQAETLNQGFFLTAVLGLGVLYVIALFLEKVPFKGSGS